MSLNCTQACTPRAHRIFKDGRGSAIFGAGASRTWGAINFPKIQLYCTMSSGKYGTNWGLHSRLLNVMVMQVDTNSHGQFAHHLGNCSLGPIPHVNQVFAFNVMLLAKPQQGLGRGLNFNSGWTHKRSPMNNALELHPDTPSRRSLVKAPRRTPLNDQLARPPCSTL